VFSASIRMGVHKGELFVVIYGPGVGDYTTIFGYVVEQISVRVKSL